MCKNMKLKFACKHHRQLCLSKCLEHHTETSIRMPGKIISLCKGRKGKQALKLRITTACSSCVTRDRAKLDEDAKLRSVLDDIETCLQSSGKDSGNVFAQLKHDAKACHEAAIKNLYVQAREDRRKNASRKPHFRELDGGEAEQDQAERNKIQHNEFQRKLEVIAQWHKRNAQTTERCPGICQQPIGEGCVCEKGASDKVSPAVRPWTASWLTLPKQPEQSIAPCPKLILRPTPPKQQNGTIERKRKRAGDDSTEPLCPSRIVRTPNENPGPRPLKRGKEKLPQMVRAA